MARHVGYLAWSVMPLLLAALAQPALARTNTSPTAGSNGSQLFRVHCASCHQPFNPVHAPWPTALEHMSQTAILAVLEHGVMRPQAGGLSHAQLAAIAASIGEAQSLRTMTVVDRCQRGAGPPRAMLRAVPGEEWNGWGIDADNSRYAQDAGLDRSDLPRLRLKWAFGIPGAAAVGSEPALFDGRLFLGGGDGLVYSLDARAGCIYWTFRPSAPSRTAISISADGRLAYFGDTQATVYAVNALTGVLVWKTTVDRHPFAMITGSPKLYRRRLFVPVSSAEEIAGPDPRYPCCSFRGSLVAVDARNGKVLWKTYAIAAPPKPTRKSSAGTQLLGPSGAAIWDSPTVDPARRAVYVGTGDNYSDPGTATSDAVMAFDMTSGRVLWVRQLTPNDRWNEACRVASPANCPEKSGWDFDIGASPILRTLPGGKRVLVVGQKSGVVYGLDPDRQGAIVWRVRIGRGGPLGGVEFGGAADDSTVYLPLSDFASDPRAGGGLFALDIATGRRVWLAAPAKPECLTRQGCSAAEEGPATLIPGAVLLGSLDGHLRAYDSRSGSPIWDFDTLRHFRTVNGVAASGGSLSFAGPVAGLGMLFVDSGYSINAGIPGNVLLAFSVDGASPAGPRQRKAATMSGSRSTR